MSAPPMINHSRRETLTTSVKRKERDGFFNGLKPSPLTTKKLAKPSPHHRPPSSHAPFKPPPPPPTPTPSPSPKPLSDNQLLGGYMAHEFLSKGTLLGQPFDSARAEATSTSRFKPVPPPRKPAEPDKEKQNKMEKYQRYMEVADLLKTNGAHFPRIVNPAQLARYLQLG